MKNEFLIFLFLSLLFGCHRDDSLSDTSEHNIEKPPTVIEFGFRSYDNAFVLTTDVSCSIIGDSLIEAWIPNIVEDKQLTPYIVYEGDAAYINSKPISGGVDLISIRSAI